MSPRRAALPWLIAGLLACFAPARAAGPEPVVVRVVARRFAYEPNEITLKRGVPAVIELRSADRRHGFRCPGLGLRAEVDPDAPARLELTPRDAGRFPFACDVYCGSGHDDMEGAIVVVE